MSEKLHAIVPIFNPMGFESRDRLASKFLKYLRENPMVQVHVAEAVFGDQEFKHSKWWHHDTRVRTDQILWYKENLINMAIKNLPHQAKYVAWIDADIRFCRDDWAEATIEALNRWPIVQPWSHAVDLGPNCEALKLYKGFIFSKYHDKNQKPMQLCHPNDPYSHKHQVWHPGFAWAARREILDEIGGLMDFTILGSGDAHMAFSLLGLLKESLALGTFTGIKLHPNYVKRLLEWEEKLRKSVKYFGYVPGAIYHFWHGHKKDRQYADRNTLLSNFQFDPDAHLIRTESGLLQYADPECDLHQVIKDFFLRRNEDA